MNARLYFLAPDSGSVMRTQLPTTALLVVVITGAAVAQEEPGPPLLEGNGAGVQSVFGGVPSDSNQVTMSQMPPGQSGKISAYRMPGSSSVMPDGRVEYIIAANTPGSNNDQCRSFTLGGGCDYLHGRMGKGCPHPWRTGPGWCDDWYVGPHWDVVVDGIMLHRQDLDVGKLDAVFGTTPGRTEQFFYEPGGRIYFTGRPKQCYEVQAGYVGVDHWRAYADYALGGAIGDRNVAYRTDFHTGELNVLKKMSGNWRLLLGVRYAEIDEDILYRDIDIDALTGRHIENKMIGFQLGARRDLWRVGECFYVEGLLNAGIYRNRIKRFETSGTISGGATVDRFTEENDLALLGEASISSVWRINNCVALRGGYQALLFDGVTLAEDVISTPAFTTTTVFFHGLQVGIEYRR